MKKLWTGTIGLGLLGFALSANAYPDEKTPQTGKETKKEPPRIALFKKYDKNANGVLDNDEKEAVRKDFTSSAKSPLKRLDRNKDGKLDDTELVALKPEAKRKEKPAAKEKRKIKDK